MTTNRETSTSLPEYRVDVVESGGRARRSRIPCQIDRDLIFDTAGLEAYLLAHWDTRVYDAFVVAAAVQFCDHTKARRSTRWGRHIVVRIPVHDSDLWGSKAVSEALHNALDFVTGDYWDISFTGRKKSVSPVRQGHLQIPGGPSVVIPYSDGLDSRSVAGLVEQEGNRDVIRVRLGAKRLNGTATARGQIPFAHVPYQVRYTGRRPAETSARTRGFRFALLSGVAAFLSGADRIVVPESGQGALGPALVPVGPVQPDYRNHPLFTDRMAALLLALFNHRVSYIYPRLWYTKGETLGKFVAECRDGPNWRKTRSCWQNHRHVSVDKKRRQCGICAACLLRRMSVHAIGCTENEETYVWENLQAERFEDGVAPTFKKREPRGALHEHAVAGTLHLGLLAHFRHAPGRDRELEKHVFQLSRSLALPEEKVRKKLTRLLQKHEQEWNDFVDSLGKQSFIARWALGAE